MSNQSHTIVAITGTVLLLATGCSALEPPEQITIAATATSAEPTPTVAGMKALLTEYADGSLDPGDGQVTVVTADTLEAVDLTPMRGDDVENALNKRTAQIEERLEGLEAVVSVLAATSDGLDVIGTLDRALESTAPGGTVVLLTSGLSTVAPLDLTQAGDWIGNPEAIIEGTDTADLPDAKEKGIVFVGVGQSYPGNGQTPAGPAARAALETILLGICEKAGAASCTIMDGIIGTGAPSSTNTVPVIDFDQVDTACAGEISLDADIIFDGDSSILKDEATPLLKPVADSLTQCTTTVVQATGYTADIDCDFNGAVGAELAIGRATAVLERLRELGTPADAIGAAENGGHLINNCPGGVYDPTLAQSNRSVMLSIQ